MNQLRTVIFLAILSTILLVLGQLIGGKVGLLIALAIALVMNLGSYWFADQLVLKMYDAQAISRHDAPELYHIVQGLTANNQMPMPKIYLINEAAPNAFATGRNPQNAAVAVTVGLIQMLDRDELAAVVAHELAHIKNRDTLIMTVAGTIAGAVSMLTNFAQLFFAVRSDDDEDNGTNPLLLIIGVIVAPIAAMLIQMAISRSREYLADETSAQMTGNPLALARALQKIETWSQQLNFHHGSAATAHMFIINPFVGENFARLFSTHPATATRIEKLTILAQKY
jgi:heat shock protein HtpX